MWRLQRPHLPTTIHGGGIWYPSPPSESPLERTQPGPSSPLRRPAAPVSSSRIAKRALAAVARDLAAVSTSPVFRLFGCALLLTSHEPLAELLLRGVVVFVCARAAVRVYPMVRMGAVEAFRKVRVWVTGTCVAEEVRGERVDGVDAA